MKMYDSGMLKYLNGKHCVICKKLYHEFEDEGHPWCEDNLQYLEWENERRHNK